MKDDKIKFIDDEQMEEEEEEEKEEEDRYYVIYRSTVDKKGHQTDYVCPMAIHEDDLEFFSGLFYEENIGH